VNEESTIRGVSVRAVLALLVTSTGLAFLYLTALLALWLLPIEQGVQIALTILVAIIGFINLSLGYYLGQKSAAKPDGQA
jgi:uncharacterized membrane-anchored protein